MNPPSAWAVAKRDAPQVAEQCWTHGFPVGPKGRFAPFLPYFWSVWNFSKSKQAAKSLLLHLSQPEAVEKLVAASGGYDLPAFAERAAVRQPRLRRDRPALAAVLRDRRVAAVEVLLEEARGLVGRCGNAQPGAVDRKRRFGHAN